MILLHAHRLDRDTLDVTRILAKGDANGAVLVLREQAQKQWREFDTADLQKHLDRICALEQDITVDTLSEALLHEDIEIISDEEFVRLCLQAEKIWSCP
jgi:sulfur transfer complex TusBCD TusB component (DsrH family)